MQSKPPSTVKIAPTDSFAVTQADGEIRHKVPARWNKAKKYSKNKQERGIWPLTSNCHPGTTTPVLPFPMSFNIPTKTMSCILHIETSTDVCSVALSQDGVCLHEKIDTNGRRHAEILAPFVEEAVSFADSHAIPLDAVSVSAGPGSYTGLRIGVSTAKGLCYGRDLKLISIPTLKVLCTPILLYREDIPDNALLCPMIDARRMEVYTAIYDRALHEVVPTDAVIVNENSFAEILDKQPVFFFGNGADKCRDTLKHPNAHFIEGIVPKASNMLPLAERALALNETEDVAYYEPFYLKQFVAGKSKNLLNG